jgi:hypothetical protein
MSSSASAAPKNSGHGGSLASSAPSASSDPYSLDTIGSMSSTASATCGGPTFQELTREELEEEIEEWRLSFAATGALIEVIEEETEFQALLTELAKRK